MLRRPRFALAVLALALTTLAALSLAGAPWDQRPPSNHRNWGAIWDYKVVATTTDPGNGNPPAELAVEEVERILDSLGMEGWEVCAMSDDTVVLKHERLRTP
jgi:hypothetical protein